MIKAAIDRIIDLVQPPTFEVDDRVYSASGKPIKDPMVMPIGELTTLSGFVSYLESPEGKGVDNGQAQIVVENHKSVSLVSTPDAMWRDRKKYVAATSETEEFPFGRYLDRETFTIKSQCLLVDSPEKAALIALVSSIVDEQSVETNDDGLSQAVVAKTGFKREKKTMRPIIELRPYRTFPEVDQPLSRFLVRMIKGREGTEVALFEADGGMWKVDAVKTIAEWLRSDKTVVDAGLKVIG